MTTRSSQVFNDSRNTKRQRVEVESETGTDLLYIVNQAPIHTLLPDPGFLAQTCKWMSQRVPNRLTTDVLSWAPLSYLRSVKPDCTLKDLSIAGNLRALKEAHATEHEQNTSKPFRTALKHGHLHIVHYYNSSGNVWPGSWQSWYAARGDQIHVLDYLRRNGHPLHPDLCRIAAKNDNLPMLKYLRKHSCPWNAATFSAAAKHGDILMLDYLLKHNCPMDDSAFYNAARRGDLDTATFFLDLDRPAPEFLFDTAAESGNIELVEYFYEGGYEGSEDACKIALNNGDMDMFQYLIDIGCPWSPEKALERAAKRGHMHIADYIKAELLDDN